MEMKGLNDCLPYKILEKISFSIDYTYLFTPKKYK